MHGMSKHLQAGARQGSGGSQHMQQMNLIHNRTQP